MVTIINRYVACVRCEVRNKTESYVVEKYNYYVVLVRVVFSFSKTQAYLFSILIAKGEFSIPEQSALFKLALTLDCNFS